MARLPIRRWPDPVLRQRCVAVGRVTTEISDLADDMLSTMYAAEGRGLAAPQVGFSLRMFVMDEGWKHGLPQPRVFIDPEILWRADERHVGPEGCLSIPGVTADVARAAAVTLRWRTLDEAVLTETLTGFAAICAQHECDHLDGIVTLDHLTPEARALVMA